MQITLQLLKTRNHHCPYEEWDVGPCWPQGSQWLAVSKHYKHSSPVWQYKKQLPTCWCCSKRQAHVLGNQSLKIKMSTLIESLSDYRQHMRFFFSKKIRSTRNVFRPLYFVIVSSPTRHSPPPPSRSHRLQKERLGPPVLAHCDL